MNARVSDAPRSAAWTGVLATVIALSSVLLSACGGGGDDPLRVPPPTPGEVQATFRTLDLAVTGTGMFAMRDEASGETIYSRFGRFDVDGQGRLVHADGGFMMGFQQAKTMLSVPMVFHQGLSASSVPAPLAPVALSLPDTATTRVLLTANLDARQVAVTSSPFIPDAFDPKDPRTYAVATGVTVFDRAGHDISLVLYFVKTHEDNWSVHYAANDVVLETVTTITFAPDLGLTAYTLTPIHVPSVPIANNETSLPINGIALNADVTQDASRFTVTALRQDGFRAGTLDGMTVSTLGGILAHYGNGVSRSGGQLALARFSESDRLGRFGAHSWTCREECVAPALDVIDYLQAGAILSGDIEVPK